MTHRVYGRFVAITLHCLYCVRTPLLRNKYIDYHWRLAFRNPFQLKHIAH